MNPPRAELSAHPLISTGYPRKNWTADRFGIESTGAKFCWPSIQIKNMIITAHALAVDEMVPLSRSHLEVIIRLDEEFQTDYSGAGRIANSMSYA